MSKIGREVCLVIIGAIAAVLIALVGIVSNLTEFLKAYTADPTLVSIAVVVSIPLIIALATNQIVQTMSSHRLQEGVISELVRALPSSTPILEMDTSDEAMRYIHQSLHRAKSLYNMRLTTSEFEQSNVSNWKITRRMDTAIMSAVKRGMHYFFIVSASNESYAKDMVLQYRLAAGKLAEVGNMSVFVLPERSPALIHFSILDFGGSNELLIGWALSDDKYFSERVFLMRDQRVVSYFERLFFHYARIGEHLS